MPTNMKFEDIYRSRWLKATDISGDDLIVTIKDVTDEQVGPEKELKLVLGFVEIDKQLILNKTNAKTLSDLHGKNPNEWIGKRIALYSTEVDFAGKTTLAIRIRLRQPGAPVPATTSVPTPPMPEPPPDY